MTVKQQVFPIKVNPIYKTRPRRKKAQSFAVYHGPWEARCPRCSEVITLCSTRKIAKDRLHTHMITVHR